MHIDQEKLLMNLVERRRIFWEPIIAACVLLAAILGVMVPLYTHSDNANRALIEAIRKDIQNFNEKCAKESKEFNEKWAAESKDFHGRLIAIEEKNKAK